MRAVLLPAAVAAGAIPIIAFAPLFNTWFGLTNPLSKMMMAAVLSFFPVMANVTRGLAGVDPSSLELMRSYAASEGKVLRKVRIPNALPYFFTALKVASTLSLIGAIVAEYFGGSASVLGRMIVQSASALRFDITWAAVSLAAVAGHRVLRAHRPRRATRDPVAQLARGTRADGARPQPTVATNRQFRPPPRIRYRSARSAASPPRRRRGRPAAAGAPQQRRGMRKQARVLGLVSAAVLFAACSVDDRHTISRQPGRPRHRRRRARPLPRARPRRRRRPRRPTSGSSSSGPRRPSSPATSRPRSRATSTRRT